MSVNPGFGGQNFIPSFMKRATQMRSFLDKNGLGHVEIEVDGGIKINNAAEVVAAGANILVSGTGIFKGDIVANIKAMRERVI
jgi:ribulose-phosphate 3-epimerase